MKTTTARCAFCGRAATPTGLAVHHISGDLRDPDDWILVCLDRAGCDERRREAAQALVDPEHVPHDLF